MWKMIGNVIEMFVYSAIYMIIVLISLKIVGAIFSTDFEKKIADEAISDFQLSVPVFLSVLPS